MTSRCRILMVNHWDELDLVVSSAASTLPAENTQKQPRGSIWRSTSAADQTMTGSQATTRAANCLVVRGHNLGGGSGTIRLQLYSDQAATAQVYDSGALAAPQASSANAGANYGMAGTSAAAADDLYGDVAPYVLYLTATAFKAAKLTYHAGALATSYIEAGRHLLGMYTEMLHQPAFEFSSGRGSNTLSTRTRGGSLRTNRGETWRRIDANFPRIDPTQRAFVDDLLQYAEIGGELWLDAFPADTTRKGRDHRMVCKQVQLDPVIFPPMSAYTKRLSVEET